MNSDDPKWEEIKARSVTTTNGFTVWCGNCDVSYKLGGGFPCPKHATDEEKAAAHRHISTLDLSQHPLIAHDAYRGIDRTTHPAPLNWKESIERAMPEVLVPANARPYMRKVLHIGNSFTPDVKDATTKVHNKAARRLMRKQAIADAKRARRDAR